MKATLTVKMDNAAFEDQRELAHILRQVARCIDGLDVLPGFEMRVADSNGNTVGKLKIKGATE
jgi:hypothetical protein